MTQDALIPATPKPVTINLNQHRPRNTETHPAQHLADRTRHIQATRCRNCGAPTLRGLNDLHAAGLITVDPTPLSPLGEALATLANRKTVALEPYGGLRFTRRGHHQITGRPAGTGLFDVYATHQCGSPALPSLPSKFPAPTPASVVDDVCPF